MDTLPLDYTAIERILPHRYPFLLVDKITEFEPDTRIVGVKAVANNEPYLSRPVHGRPSLPPTILTEAVAQVGAILILAKPENKDQLIFFRGMERVRFRAPVYPGDVVVVEEVEHAQHAFQAGRGRRFGQGGAPGCGSSWHHREVLGDAVQLGTRARHADDVAVGP